MVTDCDCIDYEPPEIKLYPKTQREILKENARLSNQKYYHTHKKQEYERHRLYCEKHPEMNRASLRKFWKTEKGKTLASKNYHKRKTKYGFNPIFENILDEPFALHHINDIDVLAIPKDIHESVLRKPVWKHREILLPIVEQIYPELSTSSTLKKA